MAVTTVYPPAAAPAAVPSAVLATPVACMANLAVGSSSGHVAMMAIRRCSGLMGAAGDAPGLILEASSWAADISFLALLVRDMRGDARTVAVLLEETSAAAGFGAAAGAAALPACGGTIGGDGAVLAPAGDGTPAGGGTGVAPVGPAADVASRGGAHSTICLLLPNLNLPEIPVPAKGAQMPAGIEC